MIFFLNMVLPLEFSTLSNSGTAQKLFLDFYSLLLSSLYGIVVIIVKQFLKTRVDEQLYIAYVISVYMLSDFK